MRGLAAVAVVVLSLCGGAGAQMGMGPAHMGEMMGPDLMAACMADPDDLGLTGEARERFEALRFETRKKVIRAMAELQILRLELGRLLDRRDFDLTAAQKLVGSISVKESEIRSAHVEALHSLAGLLEEEQWGKLRAAEGKMPGMHGAGPQGMRGGMPCMEGGMMPGKGGAMMHGPGGMMRHGPGMGEDTSREAQEFFNQD